MASFINKTTFIRPNTDRYFEDYCEGDVHEFGVYSVSEAEIIDFTSKWDPQGFHINPELGLQEGFGGVIASGFHTSAICSVIAQRHFLSKSCSMPSPGIGEMKFHRPARPGDALWVRFTILETYASKSKPDRGLIHVKLESFNQNNEIVLDFESKWFVKKRTLSTHAHPST